MFGTRTVASSFGTLSVLSVTECPTSLLPPEKVVVLSSNPLLSQSSGHPAAAGFRLRVRASKLPAAGMALPPAAGLVRALLIGESDSQISADEPPAAKIRGATPLRVAVEDAVTNLVPALDARTRSKGAPGRQPSYQEIVAVLDAQLGAVV